MGSESCVIGEISNFHVSQCCFVVGDVSYSVGKRWRVVLRAEPCRFASEIFDGSIGYGVIFSFFFLPLPARETSSIWSLCGIWMEFISFTNDNGTSFFRSLGYNGFLNVREVNLKSIENSTMKGIALSDTKPFRLANFYLIIEASFSRRAWNYRVRPCIRERAKGKAKAAEYSMTRTTTSYAVQRRLALVPSPSIILRGFESLQSFNADEM